MVSLIITTYNRPQYLKRCYDSLLNVTFPVGSSIVIIDDASTDVETIRLNNMLFIHGVKIIRYYKKENKGIKDSLINGVNISKSAGYNIFINLDSDAIVKPNFITKLLSLKKAFPYYVASGFNSKNMDNGKLRNPIIFENESVITKRYCNGINMCFDSILYDEIIYPSLLSSGNWDFNTSKNANYFVIAKPSLVEHIGLESSMGHSKNPDIAFDFYNNNDKELHLEDVTLFGIDSHDPNGIIRAGEISQRHIRFGDVKIITDKLFNGRNEYSIFCIKEMHTFINTSHVLIIHADGYPQNYEAWDNSWLQYDYIGATWDWYNEYQNGNGGFSLRSKKLLNIIKDFDIPNGVIEDDFICRKMRPYLEKEHNIKFAPVEVCKKFSIEGYGLKDNFRVYNGEFGFHSYGVKGLPIPPLKKIL